MYNILQQLSKEELKMNILILLTIICVGILFVVCETSPFGYQNKTGFHRGHSTINDDVDD